MRRLAAALMVLLLFGTRVSAQDTLGYQARAPRWAGQVATLTANTALSAITAGLFQELRGGSFKDGFTRGALGGVVIYGGKRVAAERFYGAGLIGREISAAGSSMVRNASDGIGTLDRLILPAGFLRVYWQRTTGDVAIKLDAVSAGYIAYGIVEDELHFDARESFSAGTAVFRTDNKVIRFGGPDDLAAGTTVAGTIFRSDVPGWQNEFLQRTLAHERVHVLQDDQLFITLNDHLDDWLFSKTRTKRLGRYLDLNGVTGVLSVLGQWTEHGDRPWELEALYLTR